MSRMIKDAYISIELKEQALKKLARSLSQIMKARGTACELASGRPHVSIAYTQGECGPRAVRTIVERLTHLNFKLSASEFALFSGRRTPFDYLVLKLKSSADVDSAIKIVGESLSPVELDAGPEFTEGFQGHVSLLKFEKGVLSHDEGELLLEELNASHRAGTLLGHELKIEGKKVCVSDCKRKIFALSPRKTAKCGRGIQSKRQIFS